jgi:hypothetical protein
MVAFEMGMIQAFKHMEATARACAIAHEENLVRLRRKGKEKQP